MVIAFPWSGRDWNRAVAVSGRAAMPGLPGGRGFDWRSMAGMTGALRPRAALSGLGAMARRRRGRGLGDDTTDASGGLPYADAPLPSSTLDLSYYTNLIGNPPAQTTLTTVGTPTTTTSSSAAPWYAGLLNSAVAVGGQITNYELNPLTNKSTYISTPQGGIIASNNPALAVNAAGVSVATGGVSPLSAANLSSIMPLLLLGGGLVLFMSMAKR